MSDASASKNASESTLADVHARHRLRGLQGRISHALDELYGKIGKHHHGVSGGVAGGAYPETELSESDIGFEFAIEVPGLAISDLEVVVRDGRLTIAGERKVDGRGGGKQHSVQERFFGRFERSFWLSNSLDIDRVEATLQGGV